MFVPVGLPSWVVVECSAAAASSSRAWGSFADAYDLFVDGSSALQGLSPLDRPQFGTIGIHHLTWPFGAWLSPLISTGRRVMLMESISYPDLDFRMEVVPMTSGSLS